MTKCLAIAAAASREFDRFPRLSRIVKYPARETTRFETKGKASKLTCACREGTIPNPPEVNTPTESFDTGGRVACCPPIPKWRRTRGKGKDESKSGGGLICVGFFLIKLDALLKRGEEEKWGRKQPNMGGVAWMSCRRHIYVRSS